MSQQISLPQFSISPSMGSYRAPTPFWPPPPPPPAVTKSPSLSMLYYGLIVVGTAAIVLAMYNLLFIKWSAPHPPSSPRNVRSNASVDAARSRSRIFENMDSFKYKKQKEGSVAQEQGHVLIDYECAVCLSVFEDGEEVRKLPSCKHSFHAPCIDMWLYSHSDCPLCRTTVPVISWCNRELTTTTPEEHSGEVLLVSSSSASMPV
ncbi:RING-H2 finger protein ATL52-like [Argentina anserina]|uniref:RING-H2 finger protein ATL52-like n=1 Tax=Argentina anserina TaxID=57926 RepID=UPI0021767D5F|nr:RING-H2 finger protein ATL52-like [Potentilla anserina]